MRAPKHIAAQAIRLRQKLSKPEALLWLRLRERTPGKPIFRRQHAIGPYILDFYCPKARLAIEVDGMSHDTGDRPRRDLQRDAWLKEHAVTVLRLSAAEV